ncbi:MAP3K12-binding inhibitory protein 1 isoform X2 [Cynoglossus semilaevis]|uniref:MAP3K12-binding inhibitory protein 1 isoform X2 n=1 Tax=Cynoglossus semilaevis TaxID=244447 RepID=UPI000D629956|nr:MAP3K12-binding inhibitory protein 1 isoform X2 [Cynoglossus semilaevis]
MADKPKRRAERSPPSANSYESCDMSNTTDCVRVLLKLLAEFGNELKAGDGALTIQINTDAVTPLSAAADTYCCLQEHIKKLQAVSDGLKSLVDKTSDDAVTSSTLGKQTPDPVTLCPLVSEANKSPDDVMIQIRAGKSEIERRISAFMERKQMEINENNVREFCNVIDCNQENSCARTDAVFTPYPGFKSHVKVTRVVNTYGPQTRSGGGLGDVGEQQRGPKTRHCGNSAIEERLHNIETHLKLTTAGPVPLSVYQRLKKLEDRILELEGISPEYFQSTCCFDELRLVKTRSFTGFGLLELLD